MAKKSFTKGLESLFIDLAAEKEQDDNPLLSRKPKRARPKKRELEPDLETAAPGAAEEEEEEGFSEALEAFFREELAEKVIERAEEDQKGKKRGISTPKRGIDSLIQGTLFEEDKLELGRPGKGERVTLVFDKKQVKKLQSIARMEKTYLRNIVSEIVGEFIRSYESEHGQIL